MRFSGSSAGVEAAMGRPPVILAIFQFHFLCWTFSTKATCVFYEPHQEHDILTIMTWPVTIARVSYYHTITNQKGWLGEGTPRTRGGSDYCPKAGNSIKNDDLGVDYSDYSPELVMLWELHDKFNKGCFDWGNLYQSYWLIRWRSAQFKFIW